MEITSIEFAGFVMLALAVFYALPTRPQLWWLLLASYAFYLTWAWQFALVLLGLTLANFVAGRCVRSAKSPRRGVLALGVVVNLSALVSFKYGEALLNVAALDGHRSLHVLLPIGLSFYTLQAISYLVDVARGQLAGETDFVAFALYLAYFPKLLAGPIERARAFLPQLREPRVLDDARLARSTTLIAVGLVRKIVIADSLLALIPPKTFTEPRHASGLVPWLVAYTFAVYNDFAGYTSLVRGVSGLFGIDLSPNFANPFFARNFTEFWNRWHISFSHWLRDYIYMPLSRALLRRNLSRTNVYNLVVPPMVTMLACGLWHGPGWNLLVWGGLHGTYLVGERALSLWRPRPPIQQRPAWRQALAMLVVFALVVVAMIPARMELPIAQQFVYALRRHRFWRTPDLRLILILAPALWLDWVQYRHRDETVFLRWPRAARAALLMAALLATFLVTRDDAQVPFVYEGF